MALENGSAEILSSTPIAWFVVLTDDAGSISGRAFPVLEQNGIAA